MKSPTPLQIAFASDTNYFHGLAVALTSVLQHTTGLDGAHIHILDGGLSTSQRRFLEQKVAKSAGDITLTIHQLDLEQFRDMHLMRGSTLTYARLLLPALLEHAHEVLYLDADVYYGADLLTLWKQDMAGKAVAAVHDSGVGVLGRDGPWLAPGSPDAEKPYFNAGVLKIDLDYWRRHDIGGRALLITKAEPEKCKHWDQTVLNHLLVDDVTWMPESFNLQIREENPIDSKELSCNARNLHFLAHPKPWARHSRRPSFRHWRAGYSSGVSRWPGYMLSLPYWGLNNWGVRLWESRLFIPLCRVLLVSRLYRLIPGLTAATLKNHLALEAANQRFRN